MNTGQGKVVGLSKYPTNEHHSNTCVWNINPWIHTSCSMNTELFKGNTTQAEPLILCTSKCW